MPDPWYNWKVLDHRPHKHGWAPGNYFSHCRDCGCTFEGAKRAYQCADCAYGGVDERRAAKSFDPSI